MSIELKNVTYTYSPGTSYEIHALKDINLNIPDGQFIGVIGHTGSGKSTLIQHLNALIKPTSGTVSYNGEDVWAENYNRRALRSEVGLVFQYPEHQLFESDVLSDVCYGPMNQGKSREEAEEEARKALLQVGFKEKNFDKSPFDLSGGQKKRVAIAGVLAMNPKILILDEPTAGLDPKERVRFRNLLSEYAGDKIVILSTHIVSDIEAIADEVLLMKKGKFILQGTVPELIHKANGKVWELSVSPQEARQWQTKTTVANLRHEGKEIILRIISDNMPSERAVPCEATLEDLYLFYFPTEEGVK